MNNRRSFFGQALGASLAAAATAPLAVPAMAADTTDIKLGVASYSFREFSRNHAIRMMKQLKVEYINIKEFHLSYLLPTADLEKGRKQFENAGLKILGGGTVSFPKEDPAEIKAMFEYAKASGMPLMVAAPNFKTLPMLEKYVKEYNIKIAVHNHGPEDKFFPSCRDALKLMKDMDPRMGVCIDIGHEVRSGNDLLESVALAGPRLHDMHIKDLKNMTERDSQVPVGDGILPIIGLFKLLKKMNYQGGVMLEYEVEGDAPLMGMAKSFSYMRGALAGLKG
jgi:sugar phosphate isomerase/epimerase